ncbi:MAG: iron-containing alcohol dehydrogenase [Clostridia bacterium]|nr:iron-containing alcohol dehydrogenase [Clostridia bacterium]MBO7289303.1 iron-containing alcohol dehydrogenase [Clostridia bacterium]
MNILRKLYCRTFQTIFKLAIPILPYRNPIILNSCSDIPDLLLKRKLNNVMILTDEFIYSSGLCSDLTDSLDKAGINYTVYNKITPNPTISTIEDAVKIYNSNSCKALIGFGGGSSIDAAKAVGARIARPKMSIQKMEGILKIIIPTPYTIAIPTTAGTGSEVTVTTVITDDKADHKFPVSDFPLIPDACVHDGRLLKTLPKNLTATTGMDALTHAIESYIGRSSVRSTKKDSLDSVKLISKSLKKSYDNGDDIEARNDMLEASFKAGRAFSKSYVGYCHAVAHSLGGKYHIPHGLANAVLLPYTLESYGKTIYKKAKDIAIAMGIADVNTPKKEACRILIEKIRLMNKEMGIPDKLSGIKKEDIPTLSFFADKEANPLYPVPKLMNRKELEKLYYDVMEK